MDIFCKIIKGEVPSKCLYEDEVVMVIMDVNPVSDGHSLVIPKKHYQDLYDIDNDTLLHIMKVARDISSMFYDRLGCDGITLDENNGSCQEVKHFHLHIIPKYDGRHRKEKDVEDVFNMIVEKESL